MLQSEANESAMKHSYNTFTASNGWLKSFCIRHQIKFSTLHGEGAQVCHEPIDQWLKELPTITKGYELKDIYNCDETSIFPMLCLIKVYSIILKNEWGTRFPRIDSAY